MVFVTLETTHPTITLRGTAFCRVRASQPRGSRVNNMINTPMVQTAAATPNEIHAVHGGHQQARIRVT